ncbi:MAG: NADH-quinone oxidoreductase subunit L [Planctomycetes bacterium]|nr:NADH-quinone oxidoreductase subunit L [Planctomycetota bacterium]
MQDYLWLIPLLPAFGAVINMLVGRFLPKKLVSWLACGTIFGSFVLSAITFFGLMNLPTAQRVIDKSFYDWISFSGIKISFAFLIDPLSIIMMLVVSGVGFLIHVYSIGYMADDKRYARYFGFLNLFAFAMLILVMGNNLLLMFVGWEGVGLCSYLLIGFWFEKKENAIAGMKAFIVNRIGDFGFALGVLMLFWYGGTLDFAGLAKNSHVFAPMATAIGLLLFVGATGKSAQIPLYVWLPDAMAGPTPVSALIHAATMVTAGVYMIARMNFLFVLTPTAMMVVAIVGVTTAVFAGTIGLVQNDIKKVLAYSTISQLGYMFLGVGVGAFASGIFHLMTHAFFKALLFLGSGSVIHGTGGEQDIRKMGGLKKYMPITFWTFLIATLAIAGIPGLSGFFSKDEILWKAFSSHNGHWILWVAGVFGAGLTALYMFRLVFVTFYGENRDEKHNGHNSHDGHNGIHESPKVMTIPLIVLAILSVIGGWIGIPYVLGGGNHIEHFMEPAFASHQEMTMPAESHQSEAGLEIMLMVVSVIVVLFSIFIAYYLYMKRKDLPVKIAQRFPLAYNLLLNKYYVDEIYQALIVNNLLRLNRLLAYKIDLGIIDWIVNAFGKGTVGVAFGSGWTDKTFVDGAVNATGQAVLVSGEAVNQTQTGNLKTYLAWAAGGVFVLVILFLLIIIS